MGDKKRKKSKREYVKNYTRKLVILITKEAHEALKLISYQNKISSASTAREGIEMAIKKYFKKTIANES